MKAQAELIHFSEDASFNSFMRGDSHYDFKWHYHDELELTLIVEGQGQRFVGTNTSEYTSGDLVLLGPRLPHTWKSLPFEDPEKKHVAVVVQFREDFLGEKFINLPESQSIQSMIKASGRGLHFGRDITRRVDRDLQMVSDLSGMPRLITLVQILETLAQSKDYQSLSERSEHGSQLKHEKRIDDVYNFILQHYNEDIGLEDVARVAGLSPASFSRYFKKISNKTLVGYLGELRIYRACQLLRESQDSVTNIAYQVGFHSLANFNRRFLAITGTTPREYRKEFSLEQGPVELVKDLGSN